MPAGIIVAEVVPGSAAERAGLRGIDRGSGRLGDIITHANGERVRTVAELAAALTAAGIGNTAELTVIHDGRSRTVIVQWSISADTAHTAPTGAGPHGTNRALSVQGAKARSEVS